MTEFVLGCVQLGLPYGAANRTGKPSVSGALDLLSRALAAGIRVFDVARAYGDAEERLGEGLAGQTATIVTKLAPLSELCDSDQPQKAVAAAEASIIQSCQALRRERLDTVLLHRAAHRTDYGGAIWRRLLAYKKEGVIRRLGVSVQSPAEACAALDDLEVGHIQFPFNLLDKRWSGLLRHLEERPDVTVHVRSIFLQGLLAANDPALWPPVEGVNAAALTGEIAQMARDYGRESPADLCLAYVRGHARIHGAVVGLETRAQLESNLALFAKPALTRSQCDEISASLPHLPETLLNPALWPKR